VRAILVACLSVLCAFAGCRDATEIAIEITTDVPCPHVTGTDLFAGPIGDPSTTPRATTTTCAPSLGTIVLVPSRAQNDKVLVRVVTGVDRDPASCDTANPTGCIFASRRLGYVPHTSLHLSIEMSVRCIGVVCQQGDTCYRSACVHDDSVPSAQDAGAAPLDASGLLDTTGDAPADVSVPDAPSDAPEDAPAAACQKGEIRLVNLLTSRADWIAVAGTNLFATQGSDVVVLPLDGNGAHVPPMHGQDGAAFLTPFNGRVYWVMAAGLSSLRFDGTDPHDAGQGSPDIPATATTALTASPTDLFVATDLGIQTFLSGNVLVDPQSGSPPITGIAVDPSTSPSTVFFTRSDGVRRYPFGATTYPSVWQASQQARWPMVANGSLYWVGLGASSVELIKTVTTAGLFPGSAGFTTVRGMAAIPSGVVATTLTAPSFVQLIAYSPATGAITLAPTAVFTDIGGVTTANGCIYFWATAGGASGIWAIAPD
jgi:hypothetical protein